MEIPKLEDWAPDENTSYSISVMPIEVQQMAAEVDEILKKWRSIHANNRASRVPPEILYHYTDVHGLHGIVFDNCEIWLADFRSTNDQTEGRHVRTVLSEGVEKGLPKDAATAIGNIFQVPTGYPWDEGFFLVDSLEQRFFASFSESANELSQWVHYGAGGAGYCLGVMSQSLLEQMLTVGDFTFHPQLIPVEYDPRVQGKTVEKFIADIAKCHAKYISVLGTHFRALEVMYEQLRNLLWWFQRAFALEFKNSHFMGEREWRYVVEISPVNPYAALSARTRVKGLGIAWYLPAKCIVRSIMAGPKVDYERFLAACSPLRLTRLNGVEISLSDIPLR